MLHCVTKIKKPIICIILSKNYQIYKIMIIKQYFLYINNNINFSTFCASRSVLYNQAEIWKKKKKNMYENLLFYITVGGKQGAEICKLIRLYILLGLKNILFN